MNESPVAVEFVEAQVVRPLRRAVLRPDHPVETSAYQADDDASSAHVAVRLTRDTAVAAVGTVLWDPPPWEPERSDGWRVRGMATSPDARRRGLGSLVLDALLRHVAAHGGGLVWCNARVPAQNLYARAGFAPRGEVFDIAGIGPHIQMWTTLSADR